MERHEGPLLLSARQAMELYGITRTMVYKLLHLPEAGAVRIGKRLFLEREKFVEWLHAQGERREC